MTEKKPGVFGFDAIEAGGDQGGDSGKMNIGTEQEDGKGKRKTKKEQGKGRVNKGNKTKKGDGSGKQGISGESGEGTVNRIPNPKNGNQSENGTTGIEQRSETGFIEQFKERTTRKTVEETHRRQTYLIENDLIKRLDKLARRQPKGFKTAVVNEGIRRVLDEVEGKSF